MSFARRTISITITLGAGTFGDDIGETVTLTGLRMSVSVAVAGGAAQGQLNAKIYGLTLDKINRLTQIGPIATQSRFNRILVAAGDEGQAQTVVFQGVIREAYGDFSAAPEVALNIVANSALDSAVLPIAASSWKGVGITVDSIMSFLAGKAMLKYVNDGVTEVLSNPYLQGTPLTQIQQCAKAAGINYSTENGLLAIWPKFGNRKVPKVIISPDTGMVGYPAFSSTGLSINSIFIPNLTLGGVVTVDSSLAIAKGDWHVSTLTHVLECEKPGGAWYTQMTVYYKDG